MIRMALISIFTLVSIASFTGTLYLLWITAFAIGWGGGDTDLLELIWIWRGFPLLAVVSGIASVGLMAHRKIGVIFGFSIPLAFLVYTVISLMEFTTYFPTPDLAGILSFLLCISIPFILFAGLLKLKEDLHPAFGVKHYLVSVGLASLLVLTFHFMFKF
ncbi:MAG: hypothetical protein AAFP76_10965 [Bacteroidota bacterium]